MLVPLATAKAHLRVLDSSEDAIITLYLTAAEGQALAYLGRNVFATQPEVDAAILAEDLTAMLLNASIEAAILLITGSLYALREDTTTQQASTLPMGAHALLMPWRSGMGV